MVVQRMSFQAGKRSVGLAEAGRDEWGGSKNFIGESPAFIAARERIRMIAETDATTLIEGESGTGKELAARVIHYEGARRGGPFIPVNCGALPDSLLESELFGYRRGAFTDAKDNSPGILVLAEGGTLFLDEIDSLSSRGQVVLLRFLQERTIRPLGGGAERRIDARIICACNRSLETLVGQQLFRLDLFYRLNLMYVELPPLRKRADDVQLFAEHILRKLCQRNGSPEPRLDPDFRDWLRAQPWPGNIRQLENLIEREYLLANGASVLRLSTQDGDGQASTAPLNDAEDAWNYQQAKARVLERFDRDFLTRLMRLTHGNIARAARITSKERRDLARLLQRYGISPQAYR